MYNKRFVFPGFVLACLMMQGLSAQTTQWRLIWDANSEDDMAYYRVFKGTTTDPTNLVATITHPDTIYIDRNIQRGTRYYYRLKAVDQTELESDFSEAVSAAIPRISNIAHQAVNQGSSFNPIILDNHITDPDHAASQITGPMPAMCN